MLKLSLVALFAMSMATLTIAASNMPTPPEIRGAPTIELAEIG